MDLSPHSDSRYSYCDHGSSNTDRTSHASPLGIYTPVCPDIKEYMKKFVRKNLSSPTLKFLSKEHDQLFHENISHFSPDTQSAIMALVKILSQNYFSLDPSERSLWENAAQMIFVLSHTPCMSIDRCGQALIQYAPSARESISHLDPEHGSYLDFSHLLEDSYFRKDTP